MAAVTPLLETRGLSKAFGGVQATHDVSLAVPPGEIRALIGPNGAGKTTLVSLITGRIPADAGTVFFDGTDITALPAHTRIARGIAYTFQITSVFAELSAIQNVEIAVQRGISRRDPRFAPAVQAALADVGLEHVAGHRAGDLAYGHQRLLELAMGLGQSPRLLILDEPTQGLAEAEITEFIALIPRLTAQTTVLLIEHNMDVVMALADQITVLDQGRVIAEGAPDAIRANKAVQDAYLGAENA